jgi:lysophospholipase L1-like esterase
MKVVLIGDSLMLSLYNKARGVLEAGGRTITNLSVAGHTVADQVMAWQASAVRGDKTYACAVIQVGINDIRKGVKLADTLASFATLINDLRAQNPTTKIILGLLLPARTHHDITASYETRYLPIQKAILAAGKGEIPAVDCIMTGASKALDDGTGALKKEYDSSDHMHPSVAGNKVNAVEIRAAIDALFAKKAAPAKGGGGGAGKQRQIIGQWRAPRLPAAHDAPVARALGETHAVQVRRACQVIGFTCRLEQHGAPTPVRGSALAVDVVHVGRDGGARPAVTLGTIEPGESSESKPAAADVDVRLEAGDLVYVRLVTDAAWVEAEAAVEVELITEET